MKDYVNGFENVTKCIFSVRFRKEVKTRKFSQGGSDISCEKRFFAPQNRQLLSNLTDVVGLTVYVIAIVGSA